MRKKVLLNVLLNIVIILAVLSLIMAIDRPSYLQAACGGIALIIGIYFKITLLKEVRTMTRRKRTP